jgi:hypothetical protein
VATHTELETRMLARINQLEADRIVLVEAARHWGNATYTPANDVARHLCDLIGMQTIPLSHHSRIKALGFRIFTAGAVPREL